MSKMDCRTDRSDVAPVGSAPVAMVIGALLPAGTGSMGAMLPDAPALPFAALTPALLAALRPDLVLSPLIGPTFDCFDVADILARAGFGGRYRAVTPGVPDPDLVRRELAARQPRLDFDLWVLDGTPLPRGGRGQ